MSPLVLILAPLASAGTVTMDGEVWKQLLPLDDPQEEAAPGPMVTWRDLRVKPREDEISFTARYRIHTVEPGWFDAVLADPGVEITSARWGDRPAATTTGPTGTTITGWLDGTTELVISGVVAGDAHRNSVRLGLLEAPRGRITVATELEPTLTTSGAIASVQGEFWTGARDLQIRIKPREKPGPKVDLVLGQVGIGATVLDSEFVVKAHLRWGIVQGEVSQVSFTASGAGSDLTVEGPQIADWSRSGDRVIVTLLEPEKGAVDVDVRWTTTTPSGDEARLSVPTIRTEGTFRSETSLQIARDGELEVVPSLDGWSAIAISSLPEWGSGLIEGTPTAAYTTTSSAGGTLGLFRFQPISGPPTFIDVASYTIAVNAEGRTLIRALYQVRNERGALLRITPPPNTSIIGARVAGKTAVVGIDGDTWLLPLDKSVETVDGLLSFGVEVTLLGDGFDWDKREIRDLPLPTLDAPVAVIRATLHLPPTYLNKLDAGDGGTVVAFTEGEGITYGSAIGDVDAAQADAFFQEAVTAWMDNDFDAVQANLDALGRMDARNENIDKLQANVDLITGKSSSSAGGGSVALERRVKDQAKARSSKTKAKQEETLKEAEIAYLSGDYERAESGYAAALDLGNELVQFEQDESVDVAMDNARLSSRLQDISDQNKKRKEEGEKQVADQKGRVFHSEATPLQGIGLGGAVAEAPAAGLPVSVESDRIVIERGVVLTRESLEKIPTGRSYQSAVNTPSEVEIAGHRELDDEESFDFVTPSPVPSPVPSPAPPMRDRRGPRLHAPLPSLGGMKKKVEPKPPVDVPVILDPEPLEVVATTLSVVIPSQGQTVRYQHLLLEAGAQFAIQINAKKSRRKL